jgi:uncharacterized protein YxjI
MAVAVTCACGAAFNLKDEYAGVLVRCPTCRESIRVPAKEAVLAAGGDGADARPGSVPPPLPAFVPPPLPYGTPSHLPQVAEQGGPFDRDKFLLRQKKIAINAKYAVWDESGRPILFVERPAHVLRSAASMLVIVFGALTAVVTAVVVAEAVPGSDVAKGVAAALVGLTIAAAAVALGIYISPKRHVSFYLDESRTVRVLEVLQEQKLALINADYTVRDPAGQTLARFRKNYLYNLIRKRWYVFAPDGQLVLTAREDSIILSLLRRCLGNLGVFIRTNFIFCPGDGEDVIGEFNRKFTLFDRYVLDLSADPYRTFDRRIALALGVMLDTGERR